MIGNAQTFAALIYVYTHSIMINKFAFDDDDAREIERASEKRKETFFRFRFFSAPPPTHECTLHIHPRRSAGSDGKKRLVESRLRSFDKAFVNYIVSQSHTAVVNVLTHNRL